MQRFIARTFFMVQAIALLVATPGLHAADGDQAATVPTIASFFSNPDLREAKLSPSGRWLAVTKAARSGRVLLAVIDLNTEGGAPKVVANYSDVDVRSFEWVNDERLVFNTIDLDATPEDQSFGPGLFGVKRDGSELRTLIRLRQTPLVGDGIGLHSRPLEPDHGLLTTVRDGSDDVIVGQVRFDNHDDLVEIVPKRLNVVSGRTVSIATGMPDNIARTVFDSRGVPKVAMRTTHGQLEVFWHPSIDGSWTSLAKFPALDASFDPVAVDDYGHLFVDAPSKAGTSVLERFDFTTGKPDGDPIVRIQGFDFNGEPVFDADSPTLLGVKYEADAHATTWFDPALKQLQADADQRFPGHTNMLTCAHCTTNGVLLVHSYSDQDPGSYWLYRATTRAWEPIGRTYEAIDPAQMAQLDMYRFKARDGLEIPVWETKPRGPSSTPRPAVILVHGGPWVRGVHWSWNPDAQFLASRGYVVIEPEFRGSTGYGRRLLTRGFKQWGLKMQDDVADAVQWAAARGDIDPKRVCIAGASYGGYATLMGLVRQPELYKCGVAWVAVTDPRLLLQQSWRSDASRESTLYSLPSMIGDPVKDAAMLADAAPVQHAAEIKAPLLMAFGRVDRRVPLEHGEALNAAMKAAGLSPEYIVYDGEGHGWQKVENRIDFWQHVEKFLAVQLR